MRAQQRLQDAVQLRRGVAEAVARAGSAVLGEPNAQRLVDEEQVPLLVPVYLRVATAGCGRRGCGGSERLVVSVGGGAPGALTPVAAHLAPLQPVELVLVLPVELQVLAVELERPQLVEEAEHGGEARPAWWR